MKTKKLLVTLTIAASLIVCFSSCKKDKDTPKQTCKTCVAQEKVEGVIVHSDQVCSDEAEETFRNTYSDYNVSCE